MALEYVTGRKRAEEALGYLASIGRELAVNADLEPGLQQVATLTVPYLADWCQLHVRPPGSLTPFRVGVTIPDLPATRKRQFGRFVASTAVDCTRLYSSRPDVAYLVPADELERGRAHGVACALLVPLSLRESIVGAFTIIRADDRRDGPFGPTVLAIAEEAAARISTAIELATLRTELASYRASHSFLPAHRR